MERHGDVLEGNGQAVGKEGLKPVLITASSLLVNLILLPSLKDF